MNTNNAEDLIEKVTRYIATDGQSFSTREGAVLHQEDIQSAEEANQMLLEGKSIAEILYHSGMLIPSGVLSIINKDSKLSIPHWQCKDKAGYKVQRFETGMRSVHVYGNAGSWSGSYGNYMSISDLVGYASSKLSEL